MISICIITKDESKNIRECLKRLIPLKFEIIVVDTGSIDNTKNIALEYTDKVFDYKWSNDFSAARNYSISKSSNEYVLIIDSDEYLVESNKEELEILVKKNKNNVGRILRQNILLDGNEQIKSNERINRLFRKSDFYYHGKIHEQITAKNGQDYDMYNVPIIIEHVGYSGDLHQKTRKTQRNIALLNQELKENGDDPYILYQLGKSYFMQQDYAKASEYFSKGLEFDLEPKLEYVIDMVETYGYALLNAKQYEVALQFENIYNEFGNRADFKFLMGLIYMNNEMFKEAVEEFLKATRFKESQQDGVNSFKSFFNIGVIYECLGDYDKAEMYYRKCEGYKRAKDRLHKTDIM